MKELLSTVEIAPTEAKVGSVIWMHGLGAAGARAHEDRLAWRPDACQKLGKSGQQSCSELVGSIQDYCDERGKRE